MLLALDKKVADVYNKCIGGNESAAVRYIYYIIMISIIHVCIRSCSTLQMLTAIEGCLEELFEEMETLPADKVEAAEKVHIYIHTHT